MQTLPLITHSAPSSIVAWRNGIAVTVEHFLAEVEHLVTLLPAGKHVLNVCRDRYHFAVGLAAAIMSNKVSLLPPAHTTEMVEQLKRFSADVFCLHDNPDCDIAMPRVCYPLTLKPQTLNLQTSDPQSCNSIGFEQISNGTAVKTTIPQIDVKQLVAIVFTSGSTGSPIPHSKTWGSLVCNVQAQAQRLGLTASIQYSIIGTIPPQHMYGFESTILLPMQSGNAICNVQPFYPSDICSAIASTPVPRILVSAPLHLRLLLDAELALPELALLLSATAPLSEALAHKAENSLKAPLIEIYGSTETGQIATRHTTKSAEWQLLPNVKLVQREEYIWAEGGHIEKPMPLNDIIALTAIELDSTESNSTGRFILHGRKQDLINIAGKRSSLTNLNHHLNAIDGVMDGAFFMPDEVSHDHVTRLCACVVAPTLTATDLLSALRLRIDPVFLPRPLLFVDELPRNSTGKLPREALQKLIATSITEASDNFSFANSV